MKKFIAIMCMAVLLVSSALAAGSPSEQFSATADGYTIVVEDGDFTLPNAADFGADGYDAYALNVYAKDADGNVVKIDSAVDVTFSTPVVELGASVIVAHDPEEDGTFVKEAVSNIKANEFTVSFSSLSPVVVYVKNVNEENQDSDKTGEPAVMTVVALIAMAALLGMAVTAKKEN